MIFLWTFFFLPPAFRFLRYLLPKYFFSVIVLQSLFIWLLLIFTPLKSCDYLFEAKCFVNYFYYFFTNFLTSLIHLGFFIIFLSCDFDKNWNEQIMNIWIHFYNVFPSNQNYCINLFLLRSLTFASHFFWNY